ncbi:MAG: hypothetical protein JJU00_05390 [Opitutales bacterium]|nr:hypothetical protein [Opitutales bacterium]
MLHTSASVELDHALGVLVQCLAPHDGAPGGPALRDLLQILFAGSLMREEGRAVRVRVMLSPPDAFAGHTGPPHGFHAVRFELPLRLSAGEVKRISPATDYARSLVGVWADADGFYIWGLLNSGPRWLNRASGGRRIAQPAQPYPVIQVRDPGVLAILLKDELVSELRGLTIQRRGVDVLASKWLEERFLGPRAELVRSIDPEGRNHPLAPEEQADLVHRLAVQFGRRMLSLARSSGHGGSVVFFPPGRDGLEVASRWILMKYATPPGELLALAACRL